MRLHGEYFPLFNSLDSSENLPSNFQGAQSSCRILLCARTGVLKVISLFSQKVYAVVRAIPMGGVLTYKEVARRAGRPMAYRAVGSILHKNNDYKIPCHRVIRSDGTLGGYNKGTNIKRRLLLQEKFHVIIKV